MRNRKNRFSNLFLVMVLVLMPGVGVWLVYLTVTTVKFKKKKRKKLEMTSQVNQIVKNYFFTQIFFPHVHTHTAKEQRLNFPYFHRLHDDVVNELTGRCNDWKMKSESLQTSMDQREEEEDNDREKRHIDDGGCRCLFVWVWVSQPVLLLLPQTFGVILYSGTSLSLYKQDTVICLVYTLFSPSLTHTISH